MLSLAAAALGGASACTAIEVGAGPSAVPGAGRLRPPVTLACPRGELTSFAGRVAAYQRTSTQLSLRIDTDDNTLETVRLEHPTPDDFLLNGAPFLPAAWQRVEREPGVLRDGIRVIAWVCLDGATTPVIDWRI